MWASIVLVGVVAIALGFVLEWYGVYQIFPNPGSVGNFQDRFRINDEFQLVGSALVGTGALVAGIGWVVSRYPWLRSFRAVRVMLALAGATIIAGGAFYVSFVLADDLWNWAIPTPLWATSVSLLADGIGVLVWGVGGFLGANRATVMS